MEFSFDRFYKINRKIIIWLVLFGLIYLLRAFFTLIFLTFIIGFFSFAATRYLEQRLKMGRSLAVVLVHLSFFLSFLGVYYLILTSAMSQAESLQARLPSIKQNLNDFRYNYAKKYPNLAVLFGFDVESPQLTEDDVLDWDSFIGKLSSSPIGNEVTKNLPEDIRSKLVLSDKLIAEPSEENPNPEDTVESPEDVGIFNNRAYRRLLIESLNEHFIRAPGVLDSQKLITNVRPHRYPVNKSSNSLLTGSDASANITSQDTNVETEKWMEVTAGPFAGATLRQLTYDEWSKSNPVAMSTRQVQKNNRLLFEDLFSELIVKRQYVAEREVDELINHHSRELESSMPGIGLEILKLCGKLLLAILFSFLIAYDYARLSQEVKGLASSKLRDFYQTAAEPVVRFALSVGYGFQAIVVIAFFTTVMVVPLLFILGIPSVAFLAVVTFVTSLVPVVGVVFEVGAVALVALNARGPEVAIWATLGLGVIHGIIGYVIAPMVFVRQFKLNLVAVIFMMYIGNQLAGVWGMILGVPVANYILRDVLGVPIAGEHKPNLPFQNRRRRNFQTDPIRGLEVESESPAEAERSSNFPAKPGNRNRRNRPRRRNRGPRPNSGAETTD